MKYSKILSIMAFCLLFSNLAFSQQFKSAEFNIKTMKQYAKQSKELAKNHEWVSFKVKQTNVDNGVIQFTKFSEVILHYDEKNPVVFVNNPSGDLCFRLTKKHVEIIDLQTNDISLFSKNKREKDGTNWYKQFGLYNYFNNYMRHKWYYTMPMDKIKSTSVVFLLTSFENVNINGELYCKYIGHEGRVNVYNEKTDSYDIPVDNMIVSFVNNSTGILDSIYSKGCTEYAARWETIYKIYDVNFDDRQSYLDSIFDLDNPRYAKCSRHDESNPPTKHLGYNSKRTDSLEFIDYPLVNINNDTTSIRKRDGWVLLNFWSFGCQPCLKNLQNYLHEKDSLGYRVLENQGVEILAINRSDNMDLIRETAEKTKTNDIMYSAKGMNTFINIPYLGYYYLISPDKKIVYESATLGDYSELLKAKNDYEKNHQNK